MLQVELPLHELNISDECNNDYIHLHIYIDIYIYIERERGIYISYLCLRLRKASSQEDLRPQTRQRPWAPSFTCVYIYIYREREREKERDACRKPQEQTNRERHITRPGDVHH